MEIAHARIDDRLIHGQVVTAWIRAIGKCDEILICDDKTAKDSFMQQVYSSIKPPEIALRALSLEETIQDFKDKADDPRRVLLLTRHPSDILAMMESGIEIDYLNLGGLGAGPDRKALHKFISVSEAELETLRKIQDKGAKVEIKMIPSEQGIDLTSVDKR